MSETIKISKKRLLFLYFACAGISFLCGGIAGQRWERFRTIQCEHALIEWKMGSDEAEKNTWIYFTDGKNL